MSGKRSKTKTVQIPNRIRPERCFVPAKALTVALSIAVGGSAVTTHLAPLIEAPQPGAGRRVIGAKDLKGCSTNRGSKGRPMVRMPTMTVQSSRLASLFEAGSQGREKFGQPAMPSLSVVDNQQVTADMTASPS